MKKFVLISLLLMSSWVSYAQKTDSLKNSIQKDAEAIGQGGNNELKFNVLFTALGMPEFTYERIIKNNAAIGLSVLLGTQNDFDFKLGITPYYRWYFGRKKANGFFIEANTSAISATGDKYDEFNRYISQHVVFGIGAAAGIKFFTRNGFFGETYLGLGRAIGERYFFDNYPRFGLTLGKRIK